MNNKQIAIIFSSFVFFFILMTVILFHFNILQFFPKNFPQQIMLLIALFGMSFLGTLFFGLISLKFVTDSNNCLLKSPMILRNFSKTGKNYYLKKKYNFSTRKCLLPAWALLHIISYSIISFFVPQLWYLSFIVGILWEIFEYYHNAEFWMDILWNGVGIIIGITLRTLIYPVF